MNKICDYMIIQRDKDGFGRATFEGKADLNEKSLVIARVMREDDNMTVIPWHECTKCDGGWKTELTIPQGGLYRIEARLSEGKFNAFNNIYDWAPLISCAHYVGVGEVFVLAGQSNMSAYGRDSAYDPPQLGVHLFDNGGNWRIASHPLNSVLNPIYPNNDENSGTSPGLSFGRTMSKHLGVPVGLVAAAKGGSALESWNPAEKDCFLFNALKDKIDKVGKISGIIWYQGCNETCGEVEASSYCEKFKQTVSLWRKEFGDIPVATCQLNRHAWKGESNDRFWGMVREAQRQAALTIKDVYIVPTIDMYTTDGIHNGSGACVIIGERLASVLLKCHYGLTGDSAPTITEINKIDSRSILLKFDEGHYLRTMDDLACGLNIEDENGMMKCTKISVCDDGAIVTGERDIGKKAVFHAYWEREEPAFFLRDAYGMPMLACYGVEIKQ